MSFSDLVQLHPGSRLELHGDVIIVNHFELRGCLRLVAAVGTRIIVNSTKGNVFVSTAMLSSRPVGLKNDGFVTIATTAPSHVKNADAGCDGSIDNANSASPAETYFLVGSHLVAEHHYLEEDDEPPHSPFQHCFLCRCCI